jgi:hypothetical protein
MHYVIERPACEADHPPPSIGEVKNAWSYISTPPMRLHVVVPNVEKDTSS